MTFGGVSVLANVVSAKLPLQSKVQPGFDIPPQVDGPTVWAVTEVAQAL